MDLNKKIGLKYPTKTDINLALREDRNLDKKTALPIGIFLAVFILGFAKLGVIDLLHAVDDAQRTMQQTQEQLDTLKEANLIYDDVLQEYNEVVSNSISSVVLATLEQRLELVNHYLLSKARVESFNVLDDVITASISGISLNQVSGIYTALMQNEFVDNVQIYTASTEGDSSSLTTATMTIILAVDEEKVKVAEEGGEGQQ